MGRLDDDDVLLIMGDRGLAENLPERCPAEEVGTIAQKLREYDSRHTDPSALPRLRKEFLEGSASRCEDIGVKMDGRNLNA